MDVGWAGLSRQSCQERASLTVGLLPRSFGRGREFRFVRASCLGFTRLAFQTVPSSAKWFKADGLSHDAANCGSPCSSFSGARIGLNGAIDIVQVAFATDLDKRSEDNLDPGFRCCAGIKPNCLE